MVERDRRRGRPARRWSDDITGWYGCWPTMPQAVQLALDRKKGRSTTGLIGPRRAIWVVQNLFLKCVKKIHAQIILGFRLKWQCTVWHYDLKFYKEEFKLGQTPTYELGSCSFSQETLKTFILSHFYPFCLKRPSAPRCCWAVHFIFTAHLLGLLYFIYLQMTKGD